MRKKRDPLPLYLSPLFLFSSRQTMMMTRMRMAMTTITMMNHVALNTSSPSRFKPEWKQYGYNKKYNNKTHNAINHNKDTT